MRGSAISALSNTSTRADYHEQASAAANKNAQQFLPQIVKENNKNWKKKNFPLFVYDALAVCWCLHRFYLLSGSLVICGLRMGRLLNRLLAGNIKLVYN